MPAASDRALSPAWTFSPWQRLGLVALSICGMVLCCPDYDLWWLGFVAWVPYFAAIEGLSPRRAGFYTWLIGTGTVFWGFFWITELLTKFAGFSLPFAVPVHLLFASWHGLIWGGAGALVVWLRARAPGVPIWITAPLCWIAMEATLPNIFPIYMALGWCWQPLWIQAAEIGGVTTVSGIMVAINAGLYAVLRARVGAQRLDRSASIFTLALLVLVPSYGAIRIAQVEARQDAAPKLRVGVVQGNMSIGQMAIPRQRLQILRGQQRVSAKLQAEGADLLLWGETAYPNSRSFTRASTEDLPEGEKWRVHQGFSAPVVFGAVTRDPTGAEPYPYNTAILLDDSGKIASKYDKVYRLVFGEYIPLVDPEWYLEQIPSASHLAQGAGPMVMELGDVRLGPLICYEDILPRYVRDTAALGVHAFVNLTNDAWFGKTHEPAQHLGLAIFRTVEHRKSLVRAVNTGISTFVDATGRAQVKTRVTDPDIEGPQDAEGFVADVPLMDPDTVTPYTAVGELFNALCILGIVFIAWRGPRFGRRSDLVAPTT